MTAAGRWEGGPFIFLQPILAGMRVFGSEGGGVGGGEYRVCLVAALPRVPAIVC